MVSASAMSPRCASTKQAASNPQYESRVTLMPTIIITGFPGFWFGFWERLDRATLPGINSSA